MSNSPTQGVILDPLDVLFFRDGRPFGTASRAGGSFPLPQTLAGAIWTALLQWHGCDFPELCRLAKEASAPRRSDAGWMSELLARCHAPGWIANVSVRGPWLARIPAGTSESGRGTEVVRPEVLVPAPATLQAPKKGGAGSLRVLRPLSRRALPGWNATSQAADGLRPLWVKDRTATEPAAGYLTRDGLRRFLRGEPALPDELLPTSQLLDTDHRTGIGIEPDRLTAAESKIYGASFLSLKRGMGAVPDQPCWDVVFYAEVTFPETAGPSPLTGVTTLALGGEGRRVAVRTTEPFAWDAVEPSRAGKPFLLLTTPGIFARASRPACLDGKLVAAAVPAALPVSGWDLARGGPKPNRFAAAAGSVFFLDQLPENLPPSLSDDLFDRQQGWGCYVKGTWTDE